MVADAGLVALLRPAVLSELDGRTDAAVDRPRLRDGAGERARFTIKFILRRVSEDAGDALMALNGEAERLQHVPNGEAARSSPLA